MKILWSVIVIFWVSYASASVKVCSDVIIHGTDELELTDNEKRLVCGDDKVQAYQKIPAYQAKFFLIGFLQARSYLTPEFKTEGEVLHAYVGDKAELKKIIVNIPNDKVRRFVRQELKRLYLNKNLNPSLLNSLEAEALSILRQRGYACAKVETVADPQRNIVTLNFSRNTVFDFGSLEREKIDGLHKNALERFYPFTSEQKFDWRLMELTQKRMLRAEVVQGTYFLENCSANGEEFSLEQKFLVGPPRTLRFGVGANTEVGPMARVRWSNNRLGSMASTLSAELEASFRTQSLELIADTYFWKHKPRRSILSQVEVTRESQLNYEQLLFKAGPVTMKWTEDFRDHHWQWMLGPSYEYGTFLSENRADSKSFSTGVVEGSLQWTHHDYELFDVHPQKGDQLNFRFGVRDPSLGFFTRAIKLDSSYVSVSRFSTWGRGLLIGGFRTIAGTTWVEDEVSLQSLPPLVKFFGGGSDDLRGFQLNVLPRNNGAGALSKLIFKWELRRTYLFIPSLEGFAFLDHGYFGRESFSILPQMFYSPGVGLRWRSPIGIVQSYAAKGLSLSPTDDFGYNFFIGLGTTF